jgi:hypothetical protein
MQNKHDQAPRDLRYPSLVTALSAILFLNAAYQLYLLLKFLKLGEFAVNDMPLLTRILHASPAIDLLLLLGLMVTATLCAWKSQKCALVVAALLFAQGAAVVIISYGHQSAYHQIVQALANH